MQDIDIVWLYEKSLRELDIACAVKVLARKLYGLQVEIVHQNYGGLSTQEHSGCFSAIRHFRPRIVLLPYCYSRGSHNAFLVHWRRTSIFVNLTWEQLLYPGNRIAKTPRGEFAMNHVLHHAWSEMYADFLQQRGIRPEHIFVNGNPAFALYAEPYCRYFTQREELAVQYSLDPVRTWIFFPENYNWAFYGKGMLNQMIRAGQRAEDVYAMREFCTRSFETVMQWCRSLAEEGDAEVIVRPRPATRLEDFVVKTKETLDRIPKRMHIHQHETVREWILASDIVMSSYSTSLIESAVAGKASYMAEPYPLPASLRQDWHSLLPHITNEQECKAMLAHNRSDKAGTPLEEWAKRTMLSQGDPIRNLVDYLAKLHDGKIQAPPAANRRTVTLPGHGLLPDSILFEYQRFRKWAGLQIMRMGSGYEYDYDIAVQQEIPERIRKWESLLKDDRYD